MSSDPVICFAGRPSFRDVQVEALVPIALETARRGIVKREAEVGVCCDVVGWTSSLLAGSSKDGGLGKPTSIGFLVFVGISSIVFPLGSVISIANECVREGIR